MILKPCPHFAEGWCLDCVEALAARVGALERNVARLETYAATEFTHHYSYGGRTPSSEEAYAHIMEAANQEEEP